MRILRGIPILFLFMLSLATNAQVAYERIYSGSGQEKAKGVVQLPDSSFVIVGSSTSLSSNLSDVLLLKIKRNGDVLWSKTYGGNQNDNGEDIILTQNGDIAIVGHTNSSGNGAYDVYFLIVDTDGNVLSEHTFGGSNWDFGYALTETSDNNFAITGESYSNLNGKNDAFIIKTSTLGDTIWNVSYGDTETQIAYSIVETSHNDLVICGEYEVNDDPEAFVASFQADGTFKWDTIIASDSVTILNDMKLTFDDELFAAGVKYFPGNNMQSWYVRVDTSGNVMVENQSGGADDDYTQSIAFYPKDSTFIQLGGTKSYGQLDGYDDFIYYNYNRFGLDYIGNCTLTAGFDFDDTPGEVIITKDTSVFVVGTTKNSALGYDGIYVIKSFPDCSSTGTPIESDVVDVKELQLEVNIYPNPFFNELNVISNEIIEKVEIFTLSGQKVLSEAINSFNFNLTLNLDSGIYVLNLQTRNGSVSKMISR